MSPIPTPPLPLSDYSLTGTIFITEEIVGFHRWPEANDGQPEREQPIGYLASRHRHLFKIRLNVSVEHQNREIEYHTLKRQFAHWLNHDTGWANAHGEAEFGEMSCEAIAMKILGWLVDAEPDRDYYAVSVSEDGENGSLVEATHPSSAAGSS